MELRSIEDALDRPLEVPARPARIVSLVPSVTELLFDLGAGERVVGVSRYCTEPAGALGGARRVGGQKDPDVAAIAALSPELVIAVKEENLERDVLALAARGVVVYVADVRTVEAGVGLIGEIADLVDAEPARAVALRDAARRGVDEARAIGGAHPPRRVLCPVWRDPWIAAAHDTYLYDVLELCGGRSVLAGARGSADRRYPKIDLGAACAERPEVVLLPDEPYAFGEADAAELRARMPAARVHLCDGKPLLWYGRRIAGLGAVARLVASDKAA